MTTLIKRNLKLQKRICKKLLKKSTSMCRNSFVQRSSSNLNKCMETLWRAPDSSDLSLLPHTQTSTVRSMFSMTFFWLWRWWTKTSMKSTPTFTCVEEATWWSSRMESISRTGSTSVDLTRASTCISGTPTSWQQAMSWFPLWFRICSSRRTIGIKCSPRYISINSGQK